MVQWTPNRDQVLLKTILKVHNVKIDWKELEKQMRLEGVDVTQKGLMHRITKIKSIYISHIEDGKVNPILYAKRGEDGKPKQVIPDLKEWDHRNPKPYVVDEEPEDDDDDSDEEDVEMEQEEVDEEQDDGVEEQEDVDEAPPAKKSKTNNGSSSKTATDDATATKGKGAAPTKAGKFRKIASDIPRELQAEYEEEL